MLKIALSIGLIIVGNLLAFLTLGHILDAFFKTEVLWKMVFLIVSIVPLIYIIIWKKKDFEKQLDSLLKK